MFDFVNYTYSGILSILATLFGLSYPLIINCIEKIDSKLSSEKLSERFLKEPIFIWFKIILLINLLIALVFPFFMDGNSHGRIFIGLQCLFTVVMIALTLMLFSRIISYYNVNKLKNEILHDFNKALNKNKKDEERYFTQFIDLTPILLTSVDENIVQSVYITFEEYVMQRYNLSKGKECIFDLYFYDGVTRINEFLCKSEHRAISANNGNSILTLLIFYDSIVSDTTYRYLWKNLRIQIFYNRDEWIMEYWKSACTKFELLMKEIHTYNINFDTQQYYTQEQVQTNEKNRRDFLEFHIMLCSMLMQQKKYELLILMMSYTQSEPPSYPLIPSRTGDIIDIFNKMNGFVYMDKFYASKYPMPKMHGITEGKIIAAANSFLSLLMYRVYFIRWNYGYQYSITTMALPETLQELHELKENLNIFKHMIEKVKVDKDLLTAFAYNEIDKEIDNKKTQYNIHEDIPTPDIIIDDMLEDVKNKMDELRTSSKLSKNIIDQDKLEINEAIEKAMIPYEIFLEKEICNDVSYNLNSSVSMPFENTAFLEKPDISIVDCTDCMFSYMLRNFHNTFASSFFNEYQNLEYNISSEILFGVIDKLGINKDFCIIAFGIYLDHYLNRVKNLKKSGNNFEYNGIKIFVFNCDVDIFSEMIYVMKCDDIPFMKFIRPKKDTIEKYELKQENTKYELWMSVLKIKDKKEILQEPIKSKLGNDADKYSIFTCMWLPQLYFKKNVDKVVRIKIKYLTIDEGECNTHVDDIKPYSKLSVEKQ